MKRQDGISYQLASLPRGELLSIAARRYGRDYSHLSDGQIRTCIANIVRGNLNRVAREIANGRVTAVCVELNSAIRRNHEGEVEVVSFDKLKH
jgi:hypothetical protein